MCMENSDFPADLGYDEVQSDGSLEGWTEELEDVMADPDRAMEQAYEADAIPEGEDIVAAPDGTDEAAVAPPTPTDPTAPTTAQLEAAADQEAHLTESEELQKLQQDMQQASETSQMLSNIASMRHQTMMGIIGNIR